MITLFYDDIIIKKKKLISGGKLSFPDNGIFLLKEKNGFGKSLLFKNILLNEKNSRFSMNLADQDNNCILKNISVLENISMSFNPETNEYIKLELSNKGFDFLLVRESSKLSGGEKRLVVLLRSIFSDSKIIMFDEPTNDLDFNFVNMFMALINSLSQSKLLLIISHDDRFKSIDFKRIIVNENNLCIEKNEFDAKPYLDDNTDLFKKKDHKFIKKNIPFNFFSCLLALAFSVFFMFTIIDYSEDLEKNNNSPIRENQVELYKSNSVSLGMKIFDDAFPLSSLYMLEEKNIINQLSNLKEIEDYNKTKRQTVYDLDSIDDNTSYHVYPFEFFDSVEKKTYFTLDFYMNYYYETTWDLTRLDCTELFDLPYEMTYVENPPIVEVDKAKLDFIIKNLDLFLNNPNSKYETTSCIVVFDDTIDYQSLIFNNYSKDEIMSNGTIIRSMEISECVQSIRALSGSLDCFSIILVSFIIVTVLDLLVLLFLLITFKNNIYIFRNYRLDKKDVINDSISKILFRYPKLIICIAFVLFVFIYLNQYNFYLKIVFALIFMIYLSLSYSLSKKIVASKINDYYRWYSR